MRLWHSKLKRSEIKNVLEGHKTFGSHVSIRGAANKDQQISRFLLIATKKRVHKNSCVRNRAKRRVRAALDIVCASPGADIAIFINKSAVDISFNELIGDIKKQYHSIQKCLRNDTWGCSVNINKI